MKIDFKNNFANESNWRGLINVQHAQHYNGNLEEWIEWIKKEWNCDVELGKYNEVISLDSLIFTDQAYLMAVLRFGPPSGLEHLSHKSDRSPL